MRRLFLATMLLSALTAGAQGFVTRRAQVAKQQAEISAKKALTRGEVVADERQGYFFVTCQEGVEAQQVADKLKVLGAQIRVVRGDLILLNAPFSQLEALAAVEGVMKIDVGPNVGTTTDNTRRVTQAAEVIDGSGEKLPQAYTGKGVIVALIDEGFDCTHPMFKDKDGKLRIQSYYAPGISDLGGEKVTVNGKTLTGSRFTKADDILDTLKVKDMTRSHGSHTTSIAAGSTIDVNGLSGKPLGGMAPDAEIMLVSEYCDQKFMYARDGDAVASTAFAITQGLEYLNAEAKNAKKPMVVNLSVNSHVGWHDGTSDMSRTIGRIAKDEQLPIILTTGNEADDNCHLDLQVKANEKVSLLATPGGHVWGGMKTKKNVKMQVSIVSWNDGTEYYKSPIIYNTDSKVGEYHDGNIFDFKEGADHSYLMDEELIMLESMRKYITDGYYMELWCYQTKGKDQNNKEYTYTEVFLYMSDLKMKAPTNGEDKLCIKVDLIPTEKTELVSWAYNTDICAIDKDGKRIDGDGTFSVGDWNTTGNPVSVGAYVANTKYKTVGNDVVKDDPSQGALGDIAVFSSYGPEVAGHKFPDVCAPGVLVAAAGNSFDPNLEKDYTVRAQKGYNDQFKGQKGERQYPYISSSGTSMSTPVVTGIVALWMQAAKDKGKTLNNDDIKDIIKHSSDTDSFTEAKPEQFGYGKINAYKGILYVLGIDTSIPTLSKEQPKDVSFRVNGDIVYADGAEDSTEVTVYNLQGVNVRQTTVKGGAISLEGLPQGVYALQLGKQGSTLIRK